MILDEAKQESRIDKTSAHHPEIATLEPLLAQDCGGIRRLHILGKNSSKRSIPKMIPAPPENIMRVENHEEK